MTATGIATHAGTAQTLSSPQPFVSASNARAMAPMGNSNLTINVSRTMTPKLLGQRRDHLFTYPSVVLLAVFLRSRAIIVDCTGN
jgi:hypothetical protein